VRSAGNVVVTIDVSSNGVPYSLVYSTNLISSPAPQGSGVADVEVGTGSAIDLQDTGPTDSMRHYWIETYHP
jgi:hypothetical protein